MHNNLNVKLAIFAEASIPINKELITTKIIKFFVNGQYFWAIHKDIFNTKLVLRKLLSYLFDINLNRYYAKSEFVFVSSISIDILDPQAVFNKYSIVLDKIIGYQELESIVYIDDYMEYLSKIDFTLKENYNYYVRSIRDKS